VVEAGAAGAKLRDQLLPHLPFSQLAKSSAEFQQESKVLQECPNPHKKKPQYKP